MLIPDQEHDYNELKDEVKEYLKYKKWLKRVNEIGQPLAILLFFLFIIFLYLKTDLAIYFGVSSFIVIVVGVSSETILGKLVLHNSPPSDKLVTYLVYATIDYLDRYFNPQKANTPQRKSKFRKIAIENSSQLLSTVEENWVIGKFGLAEKVLGESVSNFKELLSKRLIPVIKEGDPETLLKSANEILWQFSVFMKNPSPEALNHINESIINKNLPEMKVQKRDYSLRFLNFLKSHMFITHMMSILGIFGSTILVYFTGVSYLGLSKEGAYNTSIQFLAVLLGAYLTITFTILYKRREK